VRFRTVDVAGSRDRGVVAMFDFEETVAALPVGPLKVTLRFQPNESNPSGIAAYVGDRQVGWLNTNWTATDPQIVWVKRLHDAWIRPRFQGKCEHRSSGTYIIFYMPHNEELTAVADGLLARS
jgi:hypothetical protein